MDFTSPKEIHTKVTLARKASAYWGYLSTPQRISYLQPLLDIFTKNKEVLGSLTTKTIGMPVSVRNLIEIDPGLDFFAWYLKNSEQYLTPETTFEDKTTIHQVHYEPMGVAAVISPWNFPFCNFIWNVIPNLIVGNTVVFKHSKACTEMEQQLEEYTKLSKLPEGVLSYIYGDGTIGDCLIKEDVDLISYTGSTKVGQHLYEIAANKLIKIVLELGGSAPGIIFEDANIDQAIESIYFSRFIHSGQICDGLKRLIVHSSRLEEITKKLIAYLSAKKVGDPNDPKTDIGPLISKESTDTIQAQVADAKENGATIVVGGTSYTNTFGSFFPPTILTNVASSMRVWREEVFGPVLPIIAFTTEEEAIALANDTTYGLGAYIYTADLIRAKRVSRQIQSGMISINTAYYLRPENPWGGYKKSGLGRGNGKFGLHDLCQIKVVSSEK